jgi:hypothetical protein
LGIDLSKATRPGLEIRRVNVDMPAHFISRLDHWAAVRGLSRQALIKSWLYDRLEQESKGFEPVAVIPASELSSLMETAHLLRSPRNAKRLLEALLRSYRGGGEEMDLDEISKAVGVSADR